MTTVFLSVAAGGAIGASLRWLVVRWAGHALGLAHNSVPRGIMRAEFSQTELSEGLVTVQPGDVEALRMLCPEL